MLSPRISWPCACAPLCGWATRSRSWRCTTSPSGAPTASLAQRSVESAHCMRCMTSLGLMDPQPRSSVSPARDSPTVWMKLMCARNWHASSALVREFRRNSRSRIGPASGGRILLHLQRNTSRAHLTTRCSATLCSSNHNWAADSTGHPRRPRRITQGISKERLRQPNER